MSDSPEARFRSLYAPHFRESLGFALRRAAGPEEAADIVADTFLVAWRRLDRVPADDEARLWLYGVFLRASADRPVMHAMAAEGDFPGAFRSDVRRPARDRGYGGWRSGRGC